MGEEGIHGVGMYMGGHACMMGGMRGRGDMHDRYYEIRSMSGRCASYWNAFLFRNRNGINFFNENRDEDVSSRPRASNMKTQRISFSY